MRKSFRIIYRSFLVLFFVLISLLLATGIYVYNFKEHIIAKALGAASSQLSYPLQAKSIEVSLLRDFPKLSLLLQGVTIHNTKATPQDILVADKVDCVFNIPDLLKGHYIVDEISIERGILTFIGPEQQTSEVQNASFINTIAFPINFKRIVLKDVKCIYITPVQSGQHIIYAQDLQAVCNTIVPNLTIHITGKVTVQQLSFQNRLHQPNLPLTINSKIGYNFSNQLCTLHEGTIQQNKSKTHIKGTWSNNPYHPSINLQIDGDQLHISDLHPWLPGIYRQYLNDYQVQGSLISNIKFIQRNREPVLIQANFRFLEGSVLPKSFTQPIRIEQLKGKLSIPSIHQLNTGFLEIDEYVVKLGDSQFSGTIKLTDLEAPHLENTSQVVIDLPNWAQIMYSASNTHLQGQLIGNWNFNDNLYVILNRANKKQPFNLKAQLTAKNVEFRYSHHLFKLQDMATLLLEDDVVYFQDVSGEIDGKTFALAGKFPNGLKFGLGAEDNLYFNAKLYAEDLVLDDLFTSGQSETDSIHGIYVPNCLIGKLSFDVEKLTYKRFNANKLRGEITIQNQKFVADNVAFNFAGGKSLLEASIEPKADTIEIYTKANLHNVELDRLFSAFKNFNQHFLEDKHLGGRVSSNIEFTMQADKRFHIDANSVVGNISVQLDKGTLRDFEPLQQLSPYVPEKELKCLYFSSLKNNIHIENKTIYIPPMEVHTSVTSIQLSGTHTFDGKLDYSIVVPLRNSISKEIQRQIPEIDEQALAGLNLYLKLEGDANKYTLRYDHALFKLNLKENLKKQGNIFEQILRGEVSRKRSKELSPDEYFDF